MKLKTFILTFLMILSGPILFGQNGDPITVNSRGELENALNGDHGWYPQIKLGQSFGVSKRVDVKAGVTATLDLNGYTLSADNTTYVLNNLGNLTIKDSSTEGTGTIEGRGIYNGSHGSVDDTDLDAILTIENGIFKNTGTNGGAAIYNLGTAYINGGTFYGEYAAIHNRLAVMHIKNVYIIGKTINSYGDFRNSGALYIGENVYFYGKYSEEKNGSHSGEFTYLVAKIGNAYYATLQDAINNAKTGETVTLIADCAGDVTVTQAPDYAITIDGDDNTFKGTITVDGKSARYETTALTIKNVNFDATEGINYAACINLGVSGNSNTRYTNNVTVDKCTFVANISDEVPAVKSYTGGDWNLKINNCTVNEGMHSLAQVTNVEKGMLISGCKVYSKNGINLNSSAGVVVENSTFETQGYAVRVGVNGGTSGAITLNNNTLKSACEDGDAVIIVRGTAVTQVDLSMKENVVSGATHISGNTAATKIAADENYWDGEEAPVVAEGSAPIVVNSYYADEDLENLVRNEIGSIYAFVSSDRIFGEVTTNAIESIKIEIIGKDGNVIGSSTLEKTEHATGFNNTLTWRINLGADDSGSWAMAWNEGAPSINNMPAKVKLYVDDAAVAEAEIRYTADGDGKSPVFAAKTNAEGRINSFIACDGAYNLNNAANKLVSASADGDNIAILTAGTYNVPTGKNLTITGAVENVKFDMSKAVGINSSMTFNNVTFEYGNANYVGLQHAGTMVYNNCIINGQVFLYGTSETFNNCTFNQNSADAYNVWTYGAAQVAFNECTFNSAGKSVLIYAEGANIFNDVTVTDCDFIASSPVEGKAAIEMDSSLTAGINLTIDGETTATGFGSGNVSGNSLWNNKKGNNNDANNDITVVVDGETVLEPVYVAKIGEEKHRTLQEAINEVENGETITLLANCDEAVHINKTNVAFTIDGQISETEKVDFSGVIGINIGQNVTIRNIDFNGATANHDFIKNEGSPTGKNYNTTLLVENCSFTGNSEFDVVGVRTTHPTHTQIVNCTADGLHSLLQNTGGQKVTADKVVVINGKEGGLALGGVRAADVKNSDITANGYGIRIDAATKDAEFNIESSEFNAYIPVIARKATAQNVNFTFSGENTMTQTNGDDVWFVIENGNNGYHNGNVSLETLDTPTGNVSVTLNDTNLNREGIYGSALNGEGTEENPYLIETVNDLVFFRDRVNGGNNYAGKYVKLDADIDLSSIENWTPIGDITYNNKYQPADNDKVFSGVFNGNDKVISNLKIEKIIDEDPDTDANVGLFGITGEGAVIKNLTLTNVDIKTSGRNVGALAGFAYKATLDNITVNGDIKIEGGNNVSGVAGMTRYYAMSATNIKVIGNDGSTIVGNNIVGGIFAEIAPNGSEQTFKNLSVENVAINGVGGVGGIVGLLTLGTVEDVTVKNVALTGNTLYQGNPMGRIRLGSVSGLMGSTYATIANVTTENVTAKNLEGTEIEDLPIIGANYGAATNATEAKIGDTYYNTLQTAINAVKEGTTTINLLADITGDVTILQQEGFNILIDGNKAENANYQFDGTIYIEGNSRNTGAETLTIQNVNFYTENPSPSHDFISANSTDSDKRYAHNVTVKGCNFATSETNVNNKVVGLRLRQAYDIAVENCTSNYIFSLMWSTGVVGLDLNNVTVNNCTEGISIGGKSQNVTITDSNITSPSFGIRASVEGGQFTMTNSTIDALVPVVVRNENAITDLAQYTLSFTFEGTNNIAESNPTNYWFVAGETEYKGADEVMPTAPAGTVVVTLNDTNLSYDGVYGNFAVAKIGSVQYTSFADAATASKDGETIQLIWAEGNDPIAMAATFVGNKTVTITGTADVDWDKGWLYVGRNGEGDGHVIFKNANLTSTSVGVNNNGLGLNVSCKKEGSSTTNDGKVEIINSNIQLDYLIGKGDIKLDNSTLNVYEGFAVGARPASETGGVQRTVTMDITNGSNVIVKNHNGQGLGYESMGIMNIDATSTFETTQSFLVTADGTMNVNGGNVKVAGTLTNAGTVYVTGAANLDATVTGDGWFYMNGVTLDADTKLLGAKVRFASGTNNINGSVIDNGIFQVGIGAYNGTDANVDTENGVVVNVKNNAKIGSEGDDAYTGWIGSGFYDTDAEKAIAMTNAKYVLNIENSIAEFGYFHVSNDGELNVNGDATEKAWYNNSDYSFYAGDFIINGTANFNNTDVLALYTKVSCDNGTDNPGTLNINEGTEYEAERHNGAISGTNFILYKTGVVNANANLHIGEYSSVEADAKFNIGGTVTALGTITNNGTIELTDLGATLTTPQGPAVITNIADHKVVYKDGAYVVTEKLYVASIGDNNYESLQEAFDAAENGATIELFNDNVAVIPMNASLYGKKVTIKGTAIVDWAGWLFVGRGGEGDAELTFSNANLTSNGVSEGLNVSCAKRNDATVCNGKVTIINSTINLPEFVNRNIVVVENSTINTTHVTSGGRPASETTNEEVATAEFTLTNSKLNAVGNITNGYEGIGIMNVDANSNVNVDELTVTATGTLNSAGNITGAIVKAEEGTIQLTGGIYTTEPQDGWCAENYDAFPYDENSWVVRMVYGTQEFTLTAGWNWMSSYISEFDKSVGLSMLVNALGDNGIQIKNNLGAYTYGGSYYGWSGNLTATSVKEMYKVNVTADVTFEFEGGFVNYDELEIPLYPGWNYIGYPVDVTTNIADALIISGGANFMDVIKSQNGTSTYAGEDTGWLSSDFFTLIPGEGYMYQNTSGVIKTLKYSTKVTTTTSNNRNRNHWTVDATQYPSNMTMIATVDVEGGDYEVAAFVNGEVRGSARPIYVEELDAHILILTISGNDVEEMTFMYYDIATGEEVELSNRINYSNDAIVGSIAEPYILTRGTTGIGEAAMSQVNIYPNPTTTGTEINLQTVCDTVEVFNALGVKVAEYQNVDSIDALETAGIYVIRITNNGNVQNCRLVVK